MVEYQEVVGREKDTEGKKFLGETPKGKELYMVRYPNKTVRFIVFGSGGQLPACLDGGYSSIGLAQRAVDSYLAKLEAKEMKEDGTIIKAKK